MTEIAASLTQPELSIIIPTYNRVAVLLQSLETVDTEGSTAPFEIIVVSDGSTDGTVDAVRSGDYSRPIRVVEQPNSGAASARNHGARLAQAENLLFIDDDMRAKRGLVDAHVAALATAEVSIGRMAFDESSPRTILSGYVADWAEEFHQQLLERGVTSGFDILSGHLAIRSDVFARLGGFGEEYTQAGRYGNEDLDFGIRIMRSGAKVVYTPDACTKQLYVVTGAQKFKQTRDMAANDALLAVNGEEAAALFELRKHTVGEVRNRVADRASRRWPHTTYVATAPLRRITEWLIHQGYEHPTVHYWYGFHQGLSYRAGLADIDRQV